MPERAVAPVSPSPDVIAHYDGGVVTRADLAAELKSLPPALREKFETGTGREELTKGIIDRQLLIAEARHRKLDEDPAIQKQVKDYEDRLILSRLLEKEEKVRGAAPEAELRTWYLENKESLRLSERVRVSRLFIPAGQNGAGARVEAEKLRQRVRGGASLHDLQATGSASHVHVMDLGSLGRTDFTDAKARTMAFNLLKVGDLSQVFATDSGYAFFQLLDREASRIPSFDEARKEVAIRVLPAWKRQVFNDLVKNLRKSAGIGNEVAVSP